MAESSASVKTSSRTMDAQVLISGVPHREVVAKLVVAQLFNVPSANADAQESRSVSYKRDWSDNWENHLGRAIYAVPDVQRAYMTFERDFVNVWVLIPNRDPNVLNQIAKIQGRLFEDFGPPREMPFIVELHVIYQAGRSEKELIPEGAIILRKETA